ncbi:ABC-2 family transporter protein [Planctopirus ephydatiae]|uniref:ABC-2 family transporter protein n=2 Tax=Planctopirus ephydatiae TaxID=2528019 RepID=A0A518GM54_9PLAN|nr:ABC-2 family transporter protein [Planctopirus ephydatiae]
MHSPVERNSLMAASTRQQNHSFYRQLARLWKLAQKELRETLRDRRTLLTLLVMPLITYPLVGSVLQKFMVSGLTAIERPVYRVVATDLELSQQVAAVLREADELEESKPAEIEGAAADSSSTRDQTLPGSPILNSIEGLSTKSAPDPTTSGTQQFGEKIRAKLRPDIRVVLPQDQNSTLDVKLLVEEGYADVGIRREAKGRWELVYTPQFTASQNAHETLLSRFKIVNQKFVDDLLAAQHPPARLPAATTDLVLKLSQGGPQVSIGALIPLMLILMTITGAVYPAIDLTAGERERGTLETLMAAPLPRLEILTAKYIAVVAVAMLTGAVNLFAMFVTLSSTGLSATLLGEDGITIGLILRLAAMLALFASFFSAALLAITSHARSFKEAQAYLIPLMIISLAPGVASLLPQFQLSPTMACIPVLNLVLATRDVFSATIDWSLLALTIGTTAIATGACLALAARSFGGDALLGVSQTSWREFFQRPQESPLLHKSLIPPVAGWVALLVVTPLFIVIGGLAGSLSHLTLEVRLLLNGLVTIALFAGVPGLMMFWNRWPPVRTLALQRPRFLALLLSSLAGLSLWIVLLQVESGMMSDARKAELVKLFGSLQIQIGAIPLPIKLLALAIIPAFCEEIFFRGLLFSAWRRSLGAWPTIILTGLVFGLFHILIRDAVVLERFLPTALLGILLGAVREKTNSLWPGILLHVLNNGTVLIFGQYAEALIAWGFDTRELKTLPVAWWLSALVISATSVGLLLSVGRPVRSTENETPLPQGLTV